MCILLFLLYCSIHVIVRAKFGACVLPIKSKLFVYNIMLEILVATVRVQPSYVQCIACDCSCKV